MRKYLLIACYSLLYNGSNRKEVLVRSSFFLVILYILAQLWQATEFAVESDRQSMIWYISITEVIVLSVPLIQIDIENEIRNGDVMYQLLRPVNYLWFKICDGYGGFLFRFFVLSVIGIPFCAYLSGGTPPLSVLFVAYLIAGISGFVFILFQTTIGLLAFKIQDTAPLFWLWQRSSFVFGGLIIPLDFYPSWIKTLSFFLPFAALLYGPAHLVISFSTYKLITALLGLVFWAIIAFSLAHFFSSRLIRSLKVNGG